MFGWRQRSRGSISRDAQKGSKRGRNLSDAACRRKSSNVRCLRLEPLETRSLLSIGAATLPVLPRQYSLADLADGYLTGPTPGDPLEIAKEYMTSHAEQFGLSPADISNIRVTDRYTDADCGITHIYLRQLYNGLEVSNANFVVNVMPDGRLINVAGGFVGGLNDGTDQTMAAMSRSTSILSASARWLRLLSR